jgi:isoamylase
MHDLVSYEHKHNEANLEGNRDGSDSNQSRNWGVEGPTGNAAIRGLRDQVRRGLLACLAMTAGVPMVAHGDELGRSQGGNNNAYCHDGPVTWLDWHPEEADAALLEFTRRLFRLRRELGIGAGMEIAWLSPAGAPMRASDWRFGAGNALGARLSTGRAELLLLCNGGERAVLCQLPTAAPASGWRRRLSTARPEAGARRLRRAAIRLLPHSLVLLDQEAGNAAAGASSRNSLGASSSSSPSSIRPR